MTEDDLKTVKFFLTKYGRCKAVIYDENDWIIDVIQENSTEETKETVRREYPNAKWRNFN